MKYKLFFLMIFILVCISGFAGAKEEEIYLPKFVDSWIGDYPDLKNATGRKKEQLVTFFFRLDHTKIQDKEQRNKVFRLFDLSNKEDVALLEQLLLESKEPLMLGSGPAVIFATHGARSVPWLLERYPDAKMLAKAAIIGILRTSGELEFKEVYDFLIDKLKDKTEVPWERAEILTGGIGHYHERICDRAYSSLVWKIQASQGDLLPSGITYAMCPTNSIESRDRKIGTLTSWLTEHKEELSEFLSKKPSALLQIPEKPQLVKPELVKPELVETKKLGPAVWVVLIAAATGIFAVSLLLLLKKKASTRRQ